MTIKDIIALLYNEFNLSFCVGDIIKDDMIGDVKCFTIL